MGSAFVRVVPSSLWLHWSSGVRQGAAKVAQCPVGLLQDSERRRVVRGLRAQNSARRGQQAACPDPTGATPTITTAATNAGLGSRCRRARPLIASANRNSFPASPKQFTSCAARVLQKTYFRRGPIKKTTSQLQ